jgi:hypothetical protein
MPNFLEQLSNKIPQVKLRFFRARVAMEGVPPEAPLIQITSEVQPQHIFDAELFMDICSNYDALEGTEYSRSTRRLQDEQRSQEAFKRELSQYTMAVELLPIIERGHGITREVYSEHARIINYVARIKLNLLSIYFDNYKEDTNALEPWSELLTRFPDDYEGTENIFRIEGIPEGYPREEGILYAREFDEQGVLKRLRVYAQVHRNNLFIKSLTGSEMTEAIAMYVRAGKPAEPVALQIDMQRQNQTLASIQKFNQQYGEVLTISYFYDHMIYFKFNANLAELLDDFERFKIKELIIDKDFKQLKNSINTFGSLKQLEDTSTQLVYAGSNIRLDIIELLAKYVAYKLQKK